MDLNREPTKEERTIISLLELITDLNPKLSQFKAYMCAISHAEELEKELKQLYVNEGKDDV